MTLALLLYKLAIYGLVAYSLVQLWLLRRAAPLAAFDRVAKELKRMHHQNMVRSIILIVILVLVAMFWLSPSPHAVRVSLRVVHDSLLIATFLIMAVWRIAAGQLLHWSRAYYDTLTVLYCLIAVTGAELLREIPLALA